MKNITLQKFGLLLLLLSVSATYGIAQDNEVRAAVRTHISKETGNHSYHFNWDGHSVRRDPCRVFIGVSTSVTNSAVTVHRIIEDTPASRADIKVGDVILALDGVAVSSQRELETERDKHQPGDAFTLTILRDGIEMQAPAAFRQCTDEEKAQYTAQQESWRTKAEEMTQRAEEIKVRMETLRGSMEERFAYQGEHKFTHTERPILGIYPDDHAAVQGIRISQLVPGKGAEAAGLLPGDVITKVDGKTIALNGDLRTALLAHKPGDEVAVEYSRDGQTRRTNVALSADRASFTYTVERDPCKVFIGVYTDGRAADGQGVRVSGVIDNTPARESGILAGDVILEMDGVAVNSHNELLVERNSNKPGDVFSLRVLRAGAMITISAQFKACPTTGEPVMATEEDAKVLTAEVEIPELPGLSPPNPEAEPAFESLNVFPNPTAGMVNVRFEGEAIPTAITIADASGKVVYSNNQRRFDGIFNEQINLSGNTPGTYILSIEQGGKRVTKKILLLPRA